MAQLHQSWIDSVRDASRQQQPRMELERYLLDTLSTDPLLEKERIKLIAGDVVKASSNWIFEQDDFQRWYHSDEVRLLWIKGSPGQGKTTLLTTVVDKLEQRLEAQPHGQSNPVLSYFFCDGSKWNLNTSRAVLRGLVYAIGVKNPSFITHLQKRYETFGSQHLDFSFLSKLWEEMLQEEGLSRAYIVIDGLDECDESSPQLLDFIAKYTAELPHVKWLVSSRPSPEIAAKLASDDAKMHSSITLNTPKTASYIEYFIDSEISKIASAVNLGEFKHLLRDYVVEGAQGNFLWVKLAVAELHEELLHGVSQRALLQRLEGMPSELDSFYDSVLQKVLNSHQRTSLCLTLAAVAYRPLRLDELDILTDVDTPYARGGGEI